MFISSLFGNNNTIYIHTDKQEYYAGELVTGQVIFSVITPQHVDGVFLKIKGFEEVSFQVTKSHKVRSKENPQQTTIEYYKKMVSETRTFFKRKYCIYAHKCTLNDGSFVFPFQFQLEHKLPGTFTTCNKSRYSDNFFAKVNYLVEAEVAVPGMLTSNLHHSQDILIHEPLRQALATTDTYQETNVTFLCCISKGTVSMSANIDKNAYGPGEVVNLRLIVDNSQSKVNLEAVRLKLIRSVSASAEGETYHTSDVVVSTTSSGIPSGERAERQVQLVLPRDTEPSTFSSLLECKYKLQVELHVPWSPDVVIRQPVQIYAPQMATYIPKIEYPPGWTPNVFPISDLSKMQYTAY